MGKLIRAKDWSKTPLGHPAGWPQSLRTMVAVVLGNPFGMYIAWGKEYTQVYNDGYRPILGSSKHPNALGISTRETFEEIWHIIAPMFDGVMNGNAVGFPDFMLSLNRHGYVEDCYFDFSYSPIPKENGEVGGVLVTVLETTNKKKAEDALKKSEARFRTMADNIPNLAWMANADGWIYWYNKQWYEYTGTTEKEMLGWNWQSAHDPGILPEVLSKWRDSIASGQPFEMVFPLKGTDGKFRKFLTRILPVKDNDGKVIQWFGTNTDVTRQIEADQNLKESEERFRTMAEGSDILIATSDNTGNATYFNKAWIQFTGRSMKKLLNFGWSDLIQNEDRQIFLNSYLNALEKKQSWTGEFRILNINGENRWMLAKGATRFLPDGSFAGYISSSIDITERKIAERMAVESESHLRNTILQAPVAMCIFRGPHYIVELANDRMFELWGRRADAIMHKPIFEGLPETKGQGYESLLEAVYRTGKTCTANGVPIILPRAGKAKTVYVNLVYEAYREADGSISGILAIAVDVTTQVIARQKIEDVVAQRTKELADANHNLQKSNAELAQFAYIASHDLQEPLRKITTFSQILANRIGEGIDEQSRNYLSKINNSSTRMKTLVTDVLAYSELVKETDVFTPVNLTQILEGNINDYELLIEQKNARIQYDNLPVISAIPLQITQLFGNLIGNSLKFARADVPSIITITGVTLSGEEKISLLLDESSEYFKIQFKDNGIGFKEEYSNKIFDIFQRLHRKSDYEGTGIGLAMCKKIVQNHHGEINATGSSENGAVFNVILPV